MATQLNRVLEKASIFFMAVCVILVPLATGISVIYKRIFLIFSVIFSIAECFCLIRQRKLFSYIRRGKYYFLLSLYLLLLSTIKYFVSLVDHQGITFFTVYQMVIFSMFGFFTYVFFSEKKRFLSPFLYILSLFITFLILISKNRFLLDQSVYRFLGPYTDPNTLIIFSVLSCCCTLYFVGNSFGNFLLHVIMFSVGFASTVLSGSRAGLLALLVACVVFFIFVVYTVSGTPGIQRKKWKAMVKYGVLTILMILVFTLLLIPRTEQKESAVVGGTGYSSSHPPTNDGSDDSVEAFLERYSFQTEGTSSLTHNLRYTIWGEYLKNAPNYFLYGTDYTQSDRPIIGYMARDTHNTYLYIFYRFGILGLLSLVALTGSIFMKIFDRKKTAGQAGIFSLFCGFEIISLTLDLLNTPAYFFVLAVSYAFLNNGKTEKENDPNGPYRVLRISRWTA